LVLLCGHCSLNWQGPFRINHLRTRPRHYFSGPAFLCFATSLAVGLGSTIKFPTAQPPVELSIFSPHHDLTGETGATVGLATRISRGGEFAGPVNRNSGSVVSKSADRVVSATQISGDGVGMFAGLVPALHNNPAVLKSGSVGGELVTSFERDGTDGSTTLGGRELEAAATQADLLSAHVAARVVLKPRTDTSSESATGLVIGGSGTALLESTNATFLNRTECDSADSLEAAGEGGAAASGRSGGRRTIGECEHCVFVYIYSSCYVCAVSSLCTRGQRPCGLSVLGNVTPIDSLKQKIPARITQPPITKSVPVYSLLESLRNSSCFVV
jgi:hypothetical protein